MRRTGHKRDMVRRKKSELETAEEGERNFRVNGDRDGTKRNARRKLPLQQRIIHWLRTTPRSRKVVIFFGSICLIFLLLNIFIPLSSISELGLIGSVKIVSGSDSSEMKAQGDRNVMDEGAPPEKGKSALKESNETPVAPNSKGEIKDEFDFSAEEMASLKEMVKTSWKSKFMTPGGIGGQHHSKSEPRFLIVWPTVPVSLKGADSRPLGAIKILTKAGYNVDLLYWHDYATESSDANFDDTADRDRLTQLGVHRILGPYDAQALSESHTNVAFYHVVMTWLWPDVGYMDFLIDAISHIKRTNGLTQFIAAIDDVGITPRFFEAAWKTPGKTTEDSVQYVLSRRPSIFLGNDVDSSQGKVEEGKEQKEEEEPEFGDWKDRYGARLLHQETFLYSIADLLVGINEATLEYQKRAAPAVPRRQLSYVSPVQPHRTPGKSFQERSGYIFFGYNNLANNLAMDWFEREVMPHVNKDQKLHLVGAVSVPTICKCTGTKRSSCKPTNPDRIVCHGTLSDDEMDKLIGSVRVAINPVLESSGVATKTCRSMSLATPVVVSELDGTFGDTRTSEGAVRCPRGDVLCIAYGLNDLLTNQTKWDAASQAAPRFISKHFGNGRYALDWAEIIRHVSKRQIRVILDADASNAGESMTAQNWNMAKMLSQMSDTFNVTVMGKLEPPIDGVQIVKNRPDFSAPDVKSPFPTGFQASIVIREGWPFEAPSLPLNYCGVGCRIAQIVPWEFGPLPKYWMDLLQPNVDWLWAPSEFNRKMFDVSGWDSQYSAVASAGVDCAALKLLAEENSESTRGRVKFLYTGGFLPRKGIDVLVDEWQSVFCGENGDRGKNVKLTIHTNYELGYNAREVKEMETKIKLCDGSMEWLRQKWMTKDEHSKLMKETDVYVAPFRSEGFGLPIAEALLLGKRTIATAGGTPVDDYMLYDLTDSQRQSMHESEEVQKELRSRQLYPVGAKQTICTHPPCSGDQLCVFPPCQDFTCQCKALTGTPYWMEIDRPTLRKQLIAAYEDVMQDRTLKEKKKKKQRTNKQGAQSVCFDSLGDIYRERIMTSLSTKGRRTLQSFELPSLGPSRRLANARTYLFLLCVFLGLFVCCSLLFFIKHRRHPGSVWGHFQFNRLSI